MKEGAHIALAAAARFYTPLIVLFALALLVMRPAGGGVGLIAGLAFLLALWTHVLVFGAAAARAAMPPAFTRLLMAAGFAALAFGALAPGALFAGQLVEGGLFATVAAGGALMLAVIAGRAPTMRDGDAE
jgi:multicomponent Na+:H+ antiporter subunit B